MKIPLNWNYEWLPKQKNINALFSLCFKFTANLILFTLQKISMFLQYKDIKLVAKYWLFFVKDAIIRYLFSLA